MKLSRCPYLVQKEILDHLSVNNIFFLSLCSKNTMNFIKEIQKDQLKKVESLQYRFDGNMPFIKMKTVYDNDFNCHVILLYESKAEVDKNIDTVEEVSVDELGPAMIFFRSTDKRSDLKVKYGPDTLKSITEAIHNHLYILLGDNTKYTMDFFLTGLTYIPMLRNIQMWRHSEDYVESITVDEFIERSTCLKFFSWTSDSDKKHQMRDGSKIYEIDSLDVSVDGPVTTDILKHFEGRHASIGSSTMKVADVVQFLNAWKSGEKFRKLEDMKIFNRSAFWEIPNLVEVKNVGKKVTYFYKDIFCDMLPDELWEIKSDLYMVRDSDGHVASLELSQTGLLLSVWDMTEKEFLAKYQ